MMKIALIGAGGISKFYVQAIKKCPELVLVAVCDIDAPKLEQYKSSRMRLFSSADDLLVWGEFEAAIITTPNYTHYNLVLACLRHKKHVLCEKPLAITLREVKRLAAVAEKRNLLLTTAFHRSYNKSVNEMSLLAHKCETVYVRYLEDIIVHSGNETWYLDRKKSGGGCVMDNGINVFALLREVFGDLKLQSSSVIYRKQHRFRYDSAALIIFQHDKVRIIVELDWHHDREVKDLIFMGLDGSVKRIDLLSGSKKFKGSLWHEYDGVMRDFARKLKLRKHLPDTNNIAAMQLVEMIYEI
jgi:predicted dehydrogenase